MLHWLNCLICSFLLPFGALTVKEVCVKAPKSVLQLLRGLCFVGNVPMCLLLFFGAVFSPTLCFLVCDRNSPRSLLTWEAKEACNGALLDQGAMEVAGLA